MLLRRSSIFLMLASATIWATVPLFFSVGAEAGVDPFLYTAMFNGMGAVLSAAVLIAYVKFNATTWQILTELKVYLRTRTGRTALMLDGGGIAASNVAFIFALQSDVDATATLIVESWPLIAAFLLTGFIARFRGLSRRQILWSLVALVGFYFSVVARGQPLFQEFPVAPILAAVFSALTQAVAVAAHQRALQDLPSEFGLAPNFLIQSLRMAIAATVSLIVAVPTARTFDVGLTVWPHALAVAVAIMSSALLYALSLQASQSAAVTLVWFLTPAISIAFLALAGLASLGVNIMIGATLVISANVFLQEKLEASINVAALVTASVVLGTVILYTRGLQVPDYFNYVQVISAFYGILQGFLLTRLWDRRMRIGVLEEKWALQGRAQLLRVDRVVPPDSLQGEEAEQAFHDAAEISVLRQEMRSYSEAVLLTILGLASGIVLVVGRPNTLLGDILAFLIPVAIAYLLTITWTLLRRGSFARLATISSDVKLADAIVSYLLVLLIFAAMFMAIAVNHR